MTEWHCRQEGKQVTLKSASKKVFADPNRPSMSAVREYMASLANELGQLGFKKRGADNVIVATQADVMTGFPTLALIGDTIKVGKVDYGQTLFIEPLQDVPQGKIKLGIQWGEGLHDKGNVLPRREDKLKSKNFEWQDKAGIEGKIAEWILKSASFDIRHNLRPDIQPEKSNLKHVAPKA